MPTVKMPDGTLVQMPDQLDPALGARLRAFQDSEATKANPQNTNDADMTRPLVGSLQVAGSAIGNIIPSMINSASDLVTGGTHPHPVPTFPVGDAGKELLSNISAMLPKDTHQSQQPDDTNIPEFGPGAQALTENAARVGGDIANIIPGVAALKGVGGLVKGGVEALGSHPPDIVQALQNVGFKQLPRQAEGSAGARVGAGVVGEPSLAQQHTLTNQPVTNQLSKHEAGVPPDQELNYDTIEQARDNGPAKVYNAAHDALPEQLVQDSDLRGGIANIGDTTSQLPRSPDVEALKATMLNQPNMTRDELFSNVQQARARATKFMASDKPDDVAIGEAYMDLADKYEDFIGRQLAASKDPNAPSLDQWQQARTQFAKNYAVQGALQGADVDASKIAAMQRKDPGKLTGGLQLIAEQYNRFPLSTGFGPRTLAPGGAVGASGSLEGSLARHVTGPLIGGGIGMAAGGPVGAGIGTAVGTAGSAATNAILRRVLGGSPKNATANVAAGIKNPDLADFFPPPGPSYERLPQFPGDQGLSLADELGAGGRAQSPSGGLSLADVLSHGVEQEPSPGLSAGPMGAPKPQGVPFTQNVEHAAGGLSLASQPTLADLLEDLRDHPDVMSQGVPEDIMARTANNASGESSASLEAINRETRERAMGQDRFLIDPDGKMWPIRGVEAADARAPQGSIIVQKGVGGTPYTVLDRGGLPRSHVNGLLNRALAGGHGMSLADLLEGDGG